MHFEPDADPALATPHACEMITFQNEKAFPQRKGCSLAHSLLLRWLVTRYRFLRDRFMRAHERFSPSSEPARDRIRRNCKTIFLQIVFLWCAALFFHDLLPKIDNDSD